MLPQNVKTVGEFYQDTGRWRVPYRGQAFTTGWLCSKAQPGSGISYRLHVLYPQLAVFATNCVRHRRERPTVTKEKRRPREEPEAICRCRCRYIQRSTCTAVASVHRGKAEIKRRHKSKHKVRWNSLCACTWCAHLYPRFSKQRQLRSATSPYLSPAEVTPPTKPGFRTRSQPCSKEEVETHKLVVAAVAAAAAAVCVLRVWPNGGQERNIMWDGCFISRTPPYAA